MEPIDVLVIGAGVTGLAIAAEIAGSGRSVAIAERHPRPGMETSTHNSGVIHAGIYYPKDSLKAQLCVEGAQRMYEFCACHGVPHERCGKLIVASTEEECGQLERLQRTGLANGMERLDIVDEACERSCAWRKRATRFCCAGRACWVLKPPPTGSRCASSARRWPRAWSSTPRG